MNQIISFKYEQNEIRVIKDKQGEPRFVAKDICDVLGIDVTQIRRLDDDEKGLHQIQTPGGLQKMSTINESGLYSLILRSDKPEAKPFRKWVTSEVLPSIRKTGSYSLPKAKEFSLVPLNRELKAAISMAKAVGLKGNQAILSANKAVMKLTE